MNMTEPNWKPLERLHKTSPLIFDIGDFMWMHSYNSIECYKHRITRHYLNIDNNGSCWRYVNGEYYGVPQDIAISNIS